jgi:hypothetical protein
MDETCLFYNGYTKSYTNEQGDPTTSLHMKLGEFELVEVQDSTKSSDHF